MSNLKLTEYLAIYGAILSTVVFLWNALRAAPRVKVTLIGGLDDSEDNPRYGIFINVRNPSSRIVHLGAISLLYPTGDAGFLYTLKHILRYRNFSRAAGWVHCRPSLYGVEDGCPVSIEPGSSHEVFLPISVVSEVLDRCTDLRLMAVAQDQLWNDHYSNCYKVTEKLDKHNKSQHPTA